MTRAKYDEDEREVLDLEDGGRDEHERDHGEQDARGLGGDGEVVVCVAVMVGLSVALFLYRKL